MQQDLFDEDTFIDVWLKDHGETLPGYHDRLSAVKRRQDLIGKLMEHEAYDRLYTLSAELHHAADAVQTLAYRELYETMIGSVEAIYRPRQEAIETAAQQVSTAITSHVHQYPRQLPHQSLFDEQEMNQFQRQVEAIRSYPPITTYYIQECGATDLLARGIEYGAAILMQLDTQLSPSYQELYPDATQKQHIQALNNFLKTIDRAVIDTVDRITHLDSTVAVGMADKEQYNELIYELMTAELFPADAVSDELAVEQVWTSISTVETVVERTYELICTEVKARDEEET